MANKMISITLIIHTGFFTKNILFSPLLLTPDKFPILIVPVDSLFSPDCVPIKMLLSPLELSPVSNPIKVPLL